MLRITKRRVTFNIYARNFNFHNEMEATITLSHGQFALRLCSMKHTRHAYKISVTRKRCSLRTRNCDSTKEMKLDTKRRMSHNRFSSKNLTSYTQFIRPETSVDKPSCDWSLPQKRRSYDLRLSWHLMSATGNTCLSIQSVIQSLVRVTALRCHYFVAQSPMPLSSGCAVLVPIV